METFIEKYPYSLEAIGLAGITDHGRVDWTRTQAQAIAKTLRIMPMTVKGEGHFIARLIKSESATEALEVKQGYAKSRLKKATRTELQDYTDFAKNNLETEFYQGN